MGGSPNGGGPDPEDDKKEERSTDPKMSATITEPE